MDRVSLVLTGKFLEEIKTNFKEAGINLIDYQIGIDPLTGLYLLDITATIGKDIIEIDMEIDLLADENEYTKLIKKIRIPIKCGLHQVIEILTLITDTLIDNPISSTNGDILRSLLELQHAEELTINKQKFKFKHYGVKDNAIVVVVEDNNEHNYMLTIDEFEKAINNNNISYKLKEQP